MNKEEESFETGFKLLQQLREQDKVQDYYIFVTLKDGSHMDFSHGGGDSQKVQDGVKIGAKSLR